MADIINLHEWHKRKSEKRAVVTSTDGACAFQYVHSEDREIANLLDLLARVRSECEIGKAYRYDTGDELSGINIRGESDLLRELAEALKCPSQSF